MPIGQEGVSMGWPGQREIEVAGAARGALATAAASGSIWSREMVKIDSRTAPARDHLEVSLAYVTALAHVAQHGVELGQPGRRQFADLGVV